MNFHLTLASRNRKTGFIPVATSSRTTCPTGCPLRNKGCYAETGPLRLHWDAVSQGRRGHSFDAFCEELKRLPRHQLWRYGQAGDLPGIDNEIDGVALEKLARANARRPVIAYTHKPPTADNLAHLRKAQALGFPVNLSADTLEDADRLADTGLPTVTILAADYGRRRRRGLWAEDLSAYAARVASLTHETPRGRRIAVCPATYTDVTCSQCLVCASDRNGVIVGFPAHGRLAVKRGLDAGASLAKRGSPTAVGRSSRDQPEERANRTAHCPNTGLYRPNRPCSAPGSVCDSVV